MFWRVFGENYEAPAWTQPKSQAVPIPAHDSMRPQVDRQFIDYCMLPEKRTSSTPNLTTLAKIKPTSNP